MLRVRDSKELLIIIEAYLKRTDAPASKFGWMSTGDMSFVSKLRHKPNYDPHLSTVTRILDYIENVTTAASEDELDVMS